MSSSGLLKWVMHEMSSSGLLKWAMHEMSSSGLLKWAMHEMSSSGLLKWAMHEMRSSGVLVMYYPSAMLGQWIMDGGIGSCIMRVLLDRENGLCMV
ncbi:hypothetical protein AVEN_275709-1 [Araneus ventricosus]|uniref:Uncharacterized protein n=1 Tax=Araneus ventricosus TaxID=182803 RepID=A0A4Y2F1Z0_ARAVE|nr:hypothetical protein AVEN_275709-1 [Araneus ventricosus]